MYLSETALDRKTLYKYKLAYSQLKKKLNIFRQNGKSYGEFIFNNEMIW